MRETMDCGVLLAPGHETAMGDWVARDQPRLARVRLHLVHLRLPGSGPGGPDTHALAGLAVGLRRYDHCVLPVAPASLAWTRMSLQQARGTLATPILLLVHDMTAPAIEDLLRLGAADFIASPYCLESLRVRLGRLARRAPLPGGLVEEPGVIYAAAAPRAVGAADVRPRVPRQVLQQGLAGMRYQPGREAQEPFRQAKARVVDGFESDYIRLALSRHQGNVARAARASSKHRRAFWALMRKHGIDAGPYRRQAEQARD
ncbi:MULTISPECIES: hypothetical protein [Achromobacter]|nr:MULTISPECIES: hypothetical protein [Achromobacter]KOQ28503.1 hypothetical protein ABW35_06245 [Achromobacter xylosoxidans]KOQ34797.1 hypothetical protein ABW36_04520 [Achromobacter xylosoxidans]KOQ42005.1 hypothetical protein ABW39_21445 [Achromobacter xylosoxidans]KOQ46747.1 hypothetical protein ABW37_01610 [Achromobacter xylosoxidans]KOQ54313.1 hypothetical protein ABW38_00855 [Achromobacter xylosoxidans]